MDSAAGLGGGLGGGLWAAAAAAAAGAACRETSGRRPRARGGLKSRELSCVKR